jgi:hypothetical protein
MPARCLGSTPPPISRPREGGEDARHEPASTGREIDLPATLPTRPHALPVLGGMAADHSCGVDRTGLERITGCAS